MKRNEFTLLVVSIYIQKVCYCLRMMESWHKNLTHPSKGVEKTYEVRIKGRVRDDDLQIIANGVELEDGITAPATIVDLGFDDHNGVHEVEITIHEGRNRQVRRMFEHFGYRIHNLKRIAYCWSYF